MVSGSPYWAMPQVNRLILVRPSMLRVLLFWTIQVALAGGVSGLLVSRQLKDSIIIRGIVLDMAQELE
jgi:hypothetical protein